MRQVGTMGIALACFLLSGFGGHYPGRETRGLIPDETTEALTLQVDPEDSGCSDWTGVRARSQAEADALGVFCTLGGAVEVIPTVVKHAVTISHADGTYPLVVGDWRRFQTVGARITLTSSSVTVRASGVTGTEAVTSSTDNVVTLASNPGYGADAYRSAFLTVVSGTGSGQIKPIRTHTGTSWEVAGRLSPNLDGTSVVDIVVPATIFTLAADAEWYLGLGYHVTAASFVGLNIVGVDFSASPGDDITISGAVLLTTVRLLGVELNLQGGRVAYDSIVLDALGAEAGALRVFGGAFVSRSSISSALLVRNTTGIAITGYAISTTSLGTPFLSVYGLVADSIGTDVFLIRDGAHLELGEQNNQPMRASSVTGYVVNVEAQGRVLVRDLPNTVGNLPSGSLGDIVISGQTYGAIVSNRGTAYTWAALDAATLDQILGADGALIRGEAF